MRLVWIERSDSLAAAASEATERSWAVTPGAGATGRSCDAPRRYNCGRDRFRQGLPSAGSLSPGVAFAGVVLAGIAFAGAAFAGSAFAGVVFAGVVFAGVVF